MATNQPCLYVEIREGATNKRFYIPNEEGILPKLEAFCKTVHPHLFITRHGHAQVFKAEEIAPTPAFTGLPYMIIKQMEAKFFDHPEIGSGTLRFSADLIEKVQNCETKVSEEADLPVTLTEETQAQSGIDEIRARFAKPAPAEEPPLDDKEEQDDPNQAKLEDYPGTQTQQKLPAPPPPTQSSEHQLREVLMERQASNKLKSSEDTAPIRSHHSNVYNESQTKSSTASGRYPTMEDVYNAVRGIASDVNYLIDQSQIPSGEGVTGKQLATWFTKATVEHGWDKTFEILATKIKGL